MKQEIIWKKCSEFPPPSSTLLLLFVRTRKPHLPHLACEYITIGFFINYPDFFHDKLDYSKRLHDVDLVAWAEYPSIPNL